MNVYMNEIQTYDIHHVVRIAVVVVGHSGTFRPLFKEYYEFIKCASLFTYCFSPAKEVSIFVCSLCLPASIICKPFVLVLTESSCSSLW